MLRTLFEFFYTQSSMAIQQWGLCGRITARRRPLYEALSNISLRFFFRMSVHSVTISADVLFIVWELWPIARI